MHGSARYVAAVVALGALGWAGAAWLQPLGTILPTTRQMVDTTQEILGETRALQIGVGRVQANLGQLQRQEQLLTEQEELTRSVLAQLSRQEQLSGTARGLLAEILRTEQATSDLIRQADGAGAQGLRTVTANARELSQLSAETARIQAGSRSVDEKIDRLLVQMQGTADNFAVIGRVKDATQSAAARTTSWWNRVLDWFGR